MFVWVERKASPTFLLSLRGVCRCFLLWKSRGNPGVIPGSSLRSVVLPAFQRRSSVVLETWKGHRRNTLGALERNDDFGMALGRLGDCLGIGRRAGKGRRECLGKGLFVGGKRRTAKLLKVKFRLKQNLQAGKLTGVQNFCFGKLFECVKFLLF